MSGSLPDDELVRKAKELGLPATFYNYLETPEVPICETFPWEEQGVAAPPQITQVEVTKTEPAKTGFSFNFGGTGGSPKATFGAVAGKSNGFSGGFGTSGFAGFKNAGKPLFGAQEQNDGENEKAADEECNAQFKPVLDELPPEVQVQTGMEDEEEIFSYRAKLFRFARECSPPEWKERGLGDIKIMENTNTKVYYQLYRYPSYF